MINMDIIDAVNILERHNKWRRGADIEMENPKEIGEAIDLVVNKLRKLGYDGQRRGKEDN